MKPQAVRVTRCLSGGFNVMRWQKCVTWRRGREEAQAVADELAKKVSRERFTREEKKRKRAEAGKRVAECGVYLYFEDSGWKNCHGCGQPLVWYDTMAEAMEHKRPCAMTKVLKFTSLTPAPPPPDKDAAYAEMPLWAAFKNL